MTITAQQALAAIHQIDRAEHSLAALRMALWDAVERAGQYTGQSIIPPAGTEAFLDLAPR